MRIKYSYNRNIFNQIDTEEKAYWLGFISADGCVYIDKKGKGKLRIALSSVDDEHLHKFLKFLDSNQEVKHLNNHQGYSNHTEVSFVEITSIQIVRDLIRHGVVPNKSLILQPPTSLPEKLIYHYIRGYFDGDGSIYARARGFGIDGKKWKDSYYVSFQGTMEVLNWLKSIFGLNCKLYQRRKTDKNTYYFVFNGNKQVYKIMSKLYENSTIYLDRKFEKFKILKSLVV